MTHDTFHLSADSTPFSTIMAWADSRGFRPLISYDDSTSVVFQRRFTHVPGHFLVIFTNNDIFLGMSNDLGHTLSVENTDWDVPIMGIRVMARSATGLTLVNETLQLQREARKHGFTLHIRSSSRH